MEWAFAEQVARCLTRLRYAEEGVIKEGREVTPAELREELRRRGENNPEGDASLSRLSLILVPVLALLLALAWSVLYQNQE